MPQSSGQKASRHIAEVLAEKCGELRDRTFVRFEKDQGFGEISWGEFGKTVAQGVMGLRSLGLGEKERVAIISENRLEWLYADMIAMTGGWPSVILPPQLSDRGLGSVLRQGGVVAAFVEEGLGETKLEGLRAALPHLRHLVVFGPDSPTSRAALSFGALVRLGEERGIRSLHPDLIYPSQPDDVATVMYTSGSTGDAKGVMRTHRNVLFHITGGEALPASRPQELFALILSLNHLLGRLGFHLSVALGRTLALVKEIDRRVDLRALRCLAPTSTTVVPRVLEKIWEIFLEDPYHRTLWSAVENASHPKSLEESGRRSRVAQLRQAFLSMLGGRLEHLACGGGFLRPQICRALEIMGIPLLVSYGATECGQVATNKIGANRYGTVGKPYDKLELRFGHDGEIMVRGPSVFLGYLGDPAATREVLEPSGWYHTGDLGVLDPEGYLRILGRKRDLFTCFDGTNIHPDPIEELLEEAPYIEQALLVGHARPFLVSLIVPDKASIAARCHTTVDRLTAGQIDQCIRAAIVAINERSEYYAQIKSWLVLENAFPREVREVNASSTKVIAHRPQLEELYGEAIEQIYAAGPKIL